MQRLQQMKAYYNSLPKKEQQKLMLKNLMILLSFLLIAAVLSGTVCKTFVEALTNLRAGLFYYAFQTSWGLIITLLTFFTECILYFLLITRKRLNNEVIVTDERGVSYMKNASSGSAIWMDETETKRAFNVTEAKDTVTTIYGQLSHDGKQVVSYKYPTYGGTGDQNLLMIGSPGTGKSYAYVRTEIIQSILRGDSIICTDPSGELQGSMAKFAEDKGYTVQVLNLLEPAYSDFWNCLSEVIDPETERLDATRLNTFVSIYMANCEAPGAKPDPFWNGAQSNVFKAAIGITSWEREADILSKFRDLYKKVAISDPERENTADNVIVKMVSFKRCKGLILDAADKSGFDLDEVQEIIDAIERQAPVFNMEKVFNNLMNFNSKAAELVGSMPINHPGYLAYTTYNQSTEQVKQSTLMGMQLKMQLFSDDKITSVLSYDGINLAEMNRKKTAIFVIMSDKSTELKPIASLFFSFFFKDVQDTWDKYQQIADGNGTENPCLKTTVMLDEFFSIGVIGGDPQSFGVTMSNSRKRQLHINIIVQNITQLDALYGPEISSVIKTCCGTNLFLGCNDEDTAKYVSEFMCGEATVLNERHGESQSIFGEFGSRFKDVQFTSTQRPLLTVEEAKNWRDKVLVSKRGEHALKLNAFSWKEHPCSKYIVKTNIYDRIKRVDIKVEELNAINDAHKTNINTAIKNLKPMYGTVLAESETTVKDDVKFEPIALPLETGDEKKEEKPKRNTSTGKRGSRKTSGTKPNTKKSSLDIKSDLDETPARINKHNDEDFGSGNQLDF